LDFHLSPQEIAEIDSARQAAQASAS